MSNPEVPGVPVPPTPNDPFYKAKADLFISVLRTGFPVAWAWVVTWLVTRIPVLGQFAGTLNTVGAAVALSLITVAVYALFRVLERQTWVPDWLVRVVLGSAQRPLYVEPKVADKVNEGTDVSLTGTNDKAA